jgi:hypothetical protein
LLAARRLLAETTPPAWHPRVYANSRYIVAGEYGRILAAYRQHFEPAQLLIVLTAELEADPGDLLARVFRHLEVDDRWRPADLSTRRLVGGDRSRVPPEDLRRLLELITGAVPGLPPSALDVALEEWNTLSGPGRRGLPADLMGRLNEHFAEDATLLEHQWGAAVPWARLHTAVDQGRGRESPGSAVSLRPRIGSRTFAGAEDIARQIAGALESDSGYALIRLDAWELLLLDEGISRSGKPDLPAIGVRERPEHAAAELRRALANADAVGASDDRDSPTGMQLLEELLVRFEVERPVLCSLRIDYELLGVDPSSGRQSKPSLLHDVMQGRELAVVCPAALTDWIYETAQARASGREFDIRTAVGLDDMSELEAVFLTLAARREAYDAVLVASCGVPGKALCSRLARELEVVALDLGQPVNRFIHPRFNDRSAIYARTRWEIEQYLRELATPAPLPRHELEGRLVRSSDGQLVYIERGRARKLTHDALRSLFDQEPVDVASELLEQLPHGAPLAVVHERLTGPFVLLDGHKQAIDLGLLLVELRDGALRDAPEMDGTLPWHPIG